MMELAVHRDDHSIVEVEPVRANVFQHRVVAPCVDEFDTAYGLAQPDQLYIGGAERALPVIHDAKWRFGSHVAFFINCLDDHFTELFEDGLQIGWLEAFLNAFLFKECLER